MLGDAVSVVADRMPGPCEREFTSDAKVQSSSSTMVNIQVERYKLLVCYPLKNFSIDVHGDAVCEITGFRNSSLFAYNGSTADFSDLNISNARV
jgi:hypothetical protein